MSCRNRMYTSAMVLMVGILPLAASQAHAQTPSAASLLGASVVTLPGDTTNTDTDSNFDMLGDLTLPESDLLGVPQVTSLSHAGSGISSGWAIGGALGAAAGVAALASGGGSGTTTLLSTPSTISGPVYAAESGRSLGSIGSSVGSTSGSAGSGGVSALSEPSGSSTSPGGITSQAVTTPEPGALAMFGGMGLMLTAAKLRRRKR